MIFELTFFFRPTPLVIPHQIYHNFPHVSRHDLLFHHLRKAALAVKGRLHGTNFLAADPNHCTSAAEA
jgi:hypothetical protein